MSGVNGVDSGRNYENIINSAGKEKTDNVYGDAIFSDSSEDSLTVDDFFSLMIAQLTNQDFMNPVDDTQYLAQLAQFSTMQEMKELATYSKINYATSLIGKNVTVSTNDTSGTLVTGVVDRVSTKNDTYYVQVNGKDYTLSQITSFGIDNDDKTNSSDDTENPDAETGENNTQGSWL